MKKILSFFIVLLLLAAFSCADFSAEDDGDIADANSESAASGGSTVDFVNTINDSSPNYVSIGATTWERTESDWILYTTVYNNAAFDSDTTDDDGSVLFSENSDSNVTDVSRDVEETELTIKRVNITIGAEPTCDLTVTVQWEFAAGFDAGPYFPNTREDQYINEDNNYLSLFTEDDYPANYTIRGLNYNDEQQVGMSVLFPDSDEDYWTTGTQYNATTAPNSGMQELEDTGAAAYEAFFFAAYTENLASATTYNECTYAPYSGFSGTWFKQIVYTGKWKAVDTSGEYSANDDNQPTYKVVLITRSTTVRQWEDPLENTGSIDYDEETLSSGDTISMYIAGTGGDAVVEDYSINYNANLNDDVVANYDNMDFYIENDKNDANYGQAQIYIDDSDNHVDDEYYTLQ